MNALDEARDILSGCLYVPKEKIAEDADFRALGEVDSLTFELIVLEIEARTGSPPDPLRLLEMRSVKDLAAMLEMAR